MKMKKKGWFILTLVLLSCITQAQVKIGNNPAVIDPNAILEMESTSKGMLLPRMTTEQRDAIADPSPSMLIYNLTEKCINIYNDDDEDWRSLCGDKGAGTAVYSVDCNSLLVSGTYTRGLELDPDDNQISIDIEVSDPGTYNIVANSGGMYFAASGTFTATGQQTVVLRGQGYPLVAGPNFIVLDFKGAVCTTVINVINGLAVITSCGTAGALAGNTLLVAGTPISSGTVYKSYNPGPAYTGGNVFGMTSSIVNGIRIASPVNGQLTGSGAAIDYVLSGTPETAGNTTVSFSLNGFACSFVVPVLSGSGRASAINCSAAAAGTYQVGTPVTASNTKVVLVSVPNAASAGTFYLRTDTQNGIYFESNVVTLGAGNNQVVTLYAKGTPASPGANTYTLYVSSSATAFVSCTFSVTATLPAVIPDFGTISCSPLSPSSSYIKANNRGAEDRFGGYWNFSNPNMGKSSKISADGLTLAVGAPYEDGNITGGPIGAPDNNSWSNAGAVYIYTRTALNANWTFQVKIKPQQLGPNDNFGNSIDLSNNGNTLVVGSVNEDGSGIKVNPTVNDGAVDAGAAYVFSRSGTTWTQQAYLKASQTDAGDHFGISVAISGDGNTVAVGAMDEDGSGGINSAPDGNSLSAGAVYTYTRSGSTWSFEAYIKPNVTSVSTKGNNFGGDVALSDNGNTLAVGAYKEDGANGGINPLPNVSAPDAGAAYVFTRSGSTWSQQAYIKAGNSSGFVSKGDYFGLSVDLDASGNILAVGAPYEDGNGKNVNPGANESAANSGAAYVYNRSGSAWAFTAYLKASNTGAGDNFGASVGIAGNGNFIIVGAPLEDTYSNCVTADNTNTRESSGAAYYYGLVTGNWQSAFKFKANAANSINSYDVFGNCVSLSADGRTFAGSFGGDDGNGSGINGSVNNSNNGTNSGAVAVYTK